jgi:hypothetical protein
VLPLVLCGCSSVVEVGVSRSCGVFASSNDLAAVTNAIAAFYSVADHYQFVVDGPVQSGHGFIDYSAGPRKTNSLWVSMEIDNSQIRFVSQVLSSDLLSAQNAAMLFEQGLDKHGIQYRATKRRDFLP